MKTNNTYSNIQCSNGGIYWCRVSNAWSRASVVGVGRLGAPILNTIATPNTQLVLCMEQQLEGSNDAVAFDKLLAVLQQLRLMLVSDIE